MIRPKIIHVLASGAEGAATDRTLCCGQLVGDLPEGDDVTANPIYYTCSDPGPAAMNDPARPETES